MKRLALALLLFTLVTSGCSSLMQRSTEAPVNATSPAAAALLGKLETRNSDLKSFKANGRIRLTNTDGVQHARAVWAGYRDEKIRLEILGPAGQPMVSFAYNGKRIYLISHTEDKFYAKRAPDASLEKLISVPIDVDESLDFLSGRVPTDIYVSAEILQKEPDGTQILVLRKGERGEYYDRIYYDDNNDTIQKVESFDRNGDLSFRVVFEKMRETDGFQIPIKLLISDGEDNSLLLDIDRYWPNASVSEALFVLSKPK